MTMIRDRRWKLVHFVEGEEGQLFDLQADPREMHNLWDDPAHAETRRALLDEIFRWRVLSDVHTQGWQEGIAVGSGPFKTPPNTARQHGA
jgi:arylsulfatase A-like enzyme